MDNAEIETLFRRFAEQQVALTENLNHFQREFAEGQKRLQHEQTRLAQEHTRLAEAHTRLEEAHTRLEEAHTRLEEAHTRLEEAHTRLLVEAQLHTQERLDALIAVVDGLVRRPPAP
jgi:division protein CdvB (Snf7/Vps24/ESCRT-III family)